MQSKLVSFDQFFINEAANGKLDTSELTSIAGAGETSSQHKLNDVAAKAYEEMKKAAEADGIKWSITDSYRDYDSQVDVAARKGLYKQGGLAAVPGTSNHGWGSAIDLKLDADSQAWLQANAATYGFKTIPREPWHWEHTTSVHSAKTGKETSDASAVLIDSDLITRIINKLKEKGFSENDLVKFSKTDQKVSLSSQEDEDFYKAILTGLGANETPEKIKFLKAWRQGEGGSAKNNPFNTTKDIPGDADTKYNSVGVRNYPDRQAGLDATLATLKLPYYKNLVAMLQKDDITADELSKAKDLDTWGTGPMVRKVLAGGRVNPPSIA
jgi:hypothetical protein